MVLGIDRVQTVWRGVMVCVSLTLVSALSAETVQDVVARGEVELAPSLTAQDITPDYLFLSLLAEANREFRFALVHSTLSDPRRDDYSSREAYVTVIRNIHAKKLTALTNRSRGWGVSAELLEPMGQAEKIQTQFDQSLAAIAVANETATEHVYQEVLEGEKSFERTTVEAIFASLAIQGELQALTRSTEDAWKRLDRRWEDALQSALFRDETLEFFADYPEFTTPGATNIDDEIIKFNNEGPGATWQKAVKIRRINAPVKIEIDQKERNWIKYHSLEISAAENVRIAIKSSDGYLKARLMVLKGNSLRPVQAVDIKPDRPGQIRIDPAEKDRLYYLELAHLGLPEASMRIVSKGKRADANRWLGTAATAMIWVDDGNGRPQESEWITPEENLQREVARIAENDRKTRAALKQKVVNMVQAISQGTEIDLVITQSEGWRKHRFKSTLNITSDAAGNVTGTKTSHHPRTNSEIKVEGHISFDENKGLLLTLKETEALWIADGADVIVGGEYEIKATAEARWNLSGSWVAEYKGRKYNGGIEFE